MTSTRGETFPDTASGVLDELRVEQTNLAAAEVRKLRLVVAWSAMHSADSIVGPATGWSERALPMGGPGSPEVAEFCVPELAITLGVSHDSAGGYLRDAVELAYRLPRVYDRVLSGDVPVWRARHIAQQTYSLPLDAARFVDTHLAPVAAKTGPAAIVRLVEEARVRFDPEEAELRRLDAAEHRCLEIDLQHTGYDGTVAITGNLDYADARDLEAAVSAGAEELAGLGVKDSVHVRRSMALGVMARNQLTLDLNTDAPEGGKRVKARQVVIHVHLASHHDNPDNPVARVEEIGPLGGCVSVEQVAEWCTHPDTHVTIRPVIDLRDTPHTTAYEIPDRIRDHVTLRDPVCVFPRCTRNARRCDLDHIQPWERGGETTPANLAPLCRRHHRLKTTGGWTYQRQPDGTYTWTTRHGRQA